MKPAAVVVFGAIYCVRTPSLLRGSAPGAAAARAFSISIAAKRDGLPAEAVVDCVMPDTVVNAVRASVEIDDAVLVRPLAA